MKAADNENTCTFSMFPFPCNFNVVRLCFCPAPNAGTAPVEVPAECLIQKAQQMTAVLLEITVLTIPLRVGGGWRWIRAVDCPGDH